MQPSDILKRVRQIEITTSKLVSETFAGEYLSVFKGQGMEFAEVREYSPGDDIRAIDWNVTARLGKPFIKRFMEERELTLMLACDVSGSQFFGSGSRLKSEVVAELAAIFAFSALKNNDKVGLLLYSDQTELYIPPRKGRLHALRLVRELLAHQPKNKKTDLNGLISNINRVFKRRGILILISDFMDSGYDTPLRLAANKHDLIPVRVEDPLEEHIPNLPVLIEAEDPETGEITTYDLSSRKFRDRHKAYRYKIRDDADQLFRSIGADCIDIRTDVNVTDPVVAYFKNRMHKSKRS